MSYYATKTTVKLTGSCLQLPKVSFTHRRVVKIYIFYELDASSSHPDDPILKSYLFGAVTLTKITDIDKYQYSSYGIGFDRNSSFSFSSSGSGQNVIILE